MNIIPTESEINTLAKIGQMAIKTGFLPSSIKTPEQAIVIALKGKELGIPPFQAFSQIAVVQGKPTISAELMLALIYKNVQSAEINFEINTNEKCVIQARRKETHKYSKFEFNINDAKQAGLMGKDNWNKYTAAMLRARCITAMARALFSDAIAGCSYCAEELGAVVNEDGEVIGEMPKASASEVSISQKHNNTFSPKVTDAELVNNTITSDDIKKLNEISNKPINAPLMSKEQERMPESITSKIGFGKYKGLTVKQALDDNGKDEIINYIEYIKIKSNVENKPIAGMVKAFIDDMENLVGHVAIKTNDDFSNHNETVVRP